VENLNVLVKGQTNVACAKPTSYPMSYEFKNAILLASGVTCGIEINDKEVLITFPVSSIITHRLISARAHWTKHITWYKSGRRAAVVRFDIRGPINFVDERKTRKEVPFSGFLNLITV